MTLAADSGLEARLSNIRLKKKTRLPATGLLNLSLRDPIVEENELKNDAVPDKTEAEIEAANSSYLQEEEASVAAQGYSNAEHDAANVVSLHDSGSLRSSQYVRLLRERIDMLENRVQQQQDEIHSLHQQRSAQAAELQQILLSSMQRQIVSSSHHQTRRSTAQLHQLHEQLGTLATEASRGSACISTAVNASNNIHSVALQVVVAESAMHHGALMQHDFFKSLDDDRPDGPSSDDLLQIER